MSKLPIPTNDTPGDVGVIQERDDSHMPYRVSCGGRTFWYRDAALVLHERGPSEAPHIVVGGRRGHRGGGCDGGERMWLGETGRGEGRGR